jgi:hypothetical protein
MGPRTPADDFYYKVGEALRSAKERVKNSGT